MLLVRLQDYYLNNMPWLSIPYEKADLRASLSRRFNVLGIPTLAIIDSTGQVRRRWT